jgi:hypothetical protein
MQAVQRVLCILLVFGVLGVCASWIVCWALAYWLPWPGIDQTKRQTAFYDGHGYEKWNASLERREGVRFVTSVWHVRPPSNERGLQPIELMQIWSDTPPNVGAHPAEVIPNWATWMQPSEQNSPGSYGEVVCIFGWPFEAAHWRGSVFVSFNGRVSPMRRTGGFEVGGRVKGMGLVRLVLPTHPLWPGLLANSAFYGVILWALWFTPGAVRRELRRRRGACVRCGYDLRGRVGGIDAGRRSAPQEAATGACPECGCDGQAVRTADPTCSAW